MSFKPTAALGAYLMLAVLGLAAHANEPAATPVPEAPAAKAPPPMPPLSPLKLSIQQQLSILASKDTDKADRAAVATYYGEADSAILWVADNRFAPRAISAIDEIRRAADWGLAPRSFDTPEANETLATAEAQAAAELRISLAVLKYARHARGGRIDLGVLGRNVDQKPPVLDPKTVLASIATTSDPATYLRGLHPKHPQFEKLRQALLAARRTPATVESSPEPTSKPSRASSRSKLPQGDATQRILVNMERWRWLPEDLGAFHVWDNVPEYRMRVMKDGKVAHTETIIVGKPSTPTPMFSADMKYVIFHPTWGVPDSIKMNEIAPSLRRSTSIWGGSDPAILRQHDLRVSYNGRSVDPGSVNWDTVDIRNFQFTQPPSSKNVLGVVKFRFPNKHDVYMHDTPERELFSRTEKAFSHGCMRVKNPRRLAEVLLAEDKGWSSAQVGNAIASGATQDVTLNKQIPVHVTYFTAVVDDEGHLKTLRDLYGHDSRVSAALEGRPVRIIDRPDPAVREARRASVRAYRQPSDGGLASIFSGLFGN